MCRSFRPLPLLLNHFTLRFRFCNVHGETTKSFAYVFIYRVRSSGCPFYVYEDCIGFCMSLLTIKHSGINARLKPTGPCDGPLISIPLVGERSARCQMHTWHFCQTGLVGFEPTNNRIKICCLAAWR